MRTFGRLLGILFLLFAIGISVVYWQDPLLWRRYAGFMGTIAGFEQGELKPTEIIVGGEVLQIPAANNNNGTISDDALRDAEAYADEFDSYSLVVVHKGVVQTEWYAEGWSAEQFTQSQSMHKSLQAILIGNALEDGDIDSVDDKISKYIIEWHDDPRGDITLYELMIMSSGLAQYTFNLNPFADDFKWLYAGDTLPVILRTPSADWQPGEKFDYNNINSEILGTIIQRATGKRYSDYLSEKLWQPMGGDTAKVWLDHEGGAAHTSCCILATTMDWMRVGLMMLHEGEINGNRIISRDWHQKMIDTSPVNPRYGLQIWLGYEDEPPPSASEPFLARDTYYMAGRGGQFVFISPSEELIVVRMGPAIGPMPLKPGWDTTYLTNTVIRGIKRDIPQDIPE